MIRDVSTFLFRRYWRILPGVAFFLVCWFAFSQWESTQEENGYLLLAMALGFFMTVLMMLRYNVGWPLIDVGMLFLCMGSSLIWWFFADAIRSGHRITEQQNDVIRAMFVTALVIIFTAYPWWIMRRTRRRTSEWNGTERRVGPADRRIDHRHVSDQKPPAEESSVHG